MLKSTERENALSKLACTGVLERIVKRQSNEIVSYNTGLGSILSFLYDIEHISSAGVLNRLI